VLFFSLFLSFSFQWDRRRTPSFAFFPSLVLFAKKEGDSPPLPPFFNTREEREPLPPPPRGKRGELPGAPRFLVIGFPPLLWFYPEERSLFFLVPCPNLSGWRGSPLPPLPLIDVFPFFALCYRRHFPSPRNVRERKSPLSFSFPFCNNFARQHSRYEDMFVFSFLSSWNASPPFSPFSAHSPFCGSFLFLSTPC